MDTQISKEGAVPGWIAYLSQVECPEEQFIYLFLFSLLVADLCKNRAISLVAAERHGDTTQG